MKVTCVPYFSQYQVALAHVLLVAKRLCRQWEYASTLAEVVDLEEELRGEVIAAEKLYDESQKNGEDYVYVPRAAAKKAGLI